MSDVILAGQQWLAGQLKKNVSALATYQQGTSTLAGLVVTIGRTPFRIEDSQNGRVRFEWSDADFIITATDLKINNVVVLPVRGDRVAVNGQNYEVHSYNGEPHYRSADPYGVMLRIHAKLVK